MYAESSFGNHDHIGHNPPAAAQQQLRQQHQQQQHHNHYQPIKRSRRHSAQHQHHHQQHAATKSTSGDRFSDASVDQLDFGHADELLSSTTYYARSSGPDSSVEHTPAQTYKPTAGTNNIDHTFVDDSDDSINNDQVHHQHNHPQQQQKHDEQMWSDVDDDNDDYVEDELLSAHNSSDPEVDQSIASAASSVCTGSQISERASRALQRSSHMHMML